MEEEGEGNLGVTPIAGPTADQREVGVVWMDVGVGVGVEEKT